MSIVCIFPPDNCCIKERKVSGHLLLASTNPSSHITDPFCHVLGPQEQFLQLWQRDTSSSAYNSSAAVHLRGPPVIAALHTAFAALIRRQMVSPQ